MREVALDAPHLSPSASSFLSCVATILELPAASLPQPAEDEDPATGWTLSRWLGGLGLGVAEVAGAPEFAWPGPWIAELGGEAAGPGRYVVMFGVPSAPVWDPAGGEMAAITRGFVIAAADVALALPPVPAPPVEAGVVESIWTSPDAGAAAHSLQRASALAGRGLDGDRHVTGRGTFPSGRPGSSLTLIEAEVCESFSPPLAPHEHRRNLVTRGIRLNQLVGHPFTIGHVRCRGMRLCEPCRVVQGYAERPVLRALVHRGGLRADILEDGEITVGAPIAVASPIPAHRP